MKNAILFYLVTFKSAEGLKIKLCQQLKIDLIAGRASGLAYIRDGVDDIFTI